MPTIEQRVVEMRFDNKQFEDNAQQSIKTIDKLNESLDFENSGKSLDKLSKAGNNFKLTGMEMALSTVTEKFSALEIAGITAIQNITNKAVNWGTNFLKSNTIDQVSAGWSKYATKTSAVQTIMAATAKNFSDTGEQMEYVNDQIEKLNWFTDETSYSLLDMTSNIGKFTSNGIALDKSVTAMQGISTWASISGATISDAGRAMYNLSQAMATGSVKLIDWKSIENANMATSEFKEMAIQAAVAQGTLKKVGDHYETVGKKVKKVGEIVSATNFNEGLQAGWFTSDVLMQTLDKYGSFTEQLYDFMNITELDTASQAIKMIDAYAEGTLDLADAADEAGLSADELEKHLKHLSSDEFELGRRSFKAAQEAKTFQEAIDSVTEAVSSGWMQTFEYLFGNYQEAKELWTNLANELYDVFAASAYDRNQILKFWHKNGGYEAFLEGLSNLWTGLKNIAEPIKDAWAAVFDPFYDSEYDDMIEGKANLLIEFTKKFAEVTAKFRDYIGDWTQAGKDLLAPVEDIMEPVTEATNEAAKVVDTITRTEEKLDELVKKVIAGNYGNGQDRVNALRAEGYSYEIVQTAVNEALGYTKKYATLEKDLKEHEEALAEANKKNAEAVTEKAKAEEEAAKKEEKRANFKEKQLQDERKNIDASIKAEKDRAAAAEASEKKRAELQEARQDAEREAADQQLDILNEEQKRIEEAEAKMLQNERAETLRNTFIGVFEAINIVKVALTEAGKLGGHIIGRALKLLEGPFWNTLKNINTWFDNVRKKSNVIEDIQGFFADLTVIVDHAFDTIQRFFDRLTNNAGVRRLASSLGSLVGMIGRIFGKIFGQLTEWGTGGSAWDSIGKGFEWIADKLGDVADLIAGGVDIILGKEDAINNFLQVFGDSAPGVIDTLATSFAGLYDSISKIGGSAFGKVAEILGNFFGLINEQFTNPSSSLNNIGSNATDLLGGFIEKLQSFDINNLGNLAAGGGLLAAGIGIFKFIKSIIDSFKEVKKIPEGVNGVLDQCKATLKSYQRELNVEVIYKIAKSIGIFAAAMFGLSLLNEEDLKRVSAALVTVMGMFSLLMLAYAKIQANKSADAAGGLLDKILDPIKGFLSKIGDAFKNFTKLAGIGVGIVAFTIAVTLLANLAIKLISIPWDRFMEGVKKMGLVLSILSLAAIALAQMARGFQIQQGMALVLFAAAINMLVGPVEALGSMPFLGVVQGVVALSALAAVMGMLGLYLNDTNFIKTSLGMVLMAAAINMLVPPVLAFALLPVDKLWSGIGALTTLIGVLGMIAYVLDGTNSAATLIGMAAAMTIMMVPLLAVGMNAEVCAAGLLILVVAFGALAVVGFIAEKVASGLIILGASALAFGAGAALFGVGCLAVAAGIYLVAKALPLIIDGLIYIGTAILEHGQELAIGLGVILAAAAAAVVAASPAIGGAIASLISAAAGAIVGALPTLGAHLVTLVMGLLFVLYTIAPTVVNGILDIIVATMHALADGLRNHVAPLFGAIVDILDACWDLVVEFVASILSMIPIFGNDIADAVRGAKDWVDPDAGAEIGETIKENAVAQVQDTGPKMKAAMDESVAGVDVQSSANEFAANTSGTFGDAMAENSDEANPGIDQMLANMLAYASEQTGTPVEELAATWNGGLGDAINLGSFEVTDAVVNTVTSAADSADAEADSRGPITGEDYAYGVADGATSQTALAYVSSAGTTLGTTLNNATKAALQEHSPSKKGAEVGKFYDFGIAKGVLDNDDTISDAGKRVGNTLMDTMRNIVSRIGDVIDGDMDLNPTITPVLDLSNIQNGTSALNGMFGSQSFALAAANGSAFEANRLAALNKLETASTNADVVAALGLLRGDVNSLNDAFSNTQVVLDSGALVGATARQMDNALGRINTYRGRGI